MTGLRLMYRTDMSCLRPLTVTEHRSGLRCFETVPMDPLRDELDFNPLILTRVPGRKNELARVD